MIDQLTVFLGNEKGRLTALCDTLGKAQVQMDALAVADTTDYGIVRIICDDPKKAVEACKDAGFTAALAQVTAIRVPDVPGGAAKVFAAIDEADANVAYAYCFTSSVGAATLAVKCDKDIRSAMQAAGFELLHQADLYT